MSEWPKQVAESDLNRWGGSNYVSVIPADLGRELYEALELASGWIEYGEDQIPAEAALRRYEREVGK